MIDLDCLARKPAAFRSLTGLTPAEFEALAADFLPAYHRHRSAATATRRERRPHRRAPGAGGRYALDLRRRLLLALVWLKVYPTYEVLGLLFGLDKGNALRNARDVLEVLETLDDFPFDRPPAGRPKLRSLTAVMEAYPAVRLVIDSKEQRIYRPGGGHERQKPFYSGKKKAHTLKTQVAIDPQGVIEAISPGMPGSINDVRLLRETGLLDRLGEGEAAMMDKGYEGAEKGYAGVPIVMPKKDRKARPLTEEQKAENRRISRYRVVVEHTMAQLNRFTVLRQVYRGSRLRHGQVGRAVAVLVNRRIRVKPLKVYQSAA
jgi:DDE superfamily endonuclease/Helix-turn-helix of DDE superfamily endonuclease